MKTMTNWVLALGLAGGLGLAASGANETLASGAEGNRAAWMQGRYGIMVHWLYPSEGDIDRWTDNFNVPGFLDDFASSGADWLIFTSGQCRGAYAAPNAAFDRYCGVGHTSKRDLLMEIAQGVKAQGKRFIVYAAIDFEGDGCREHAMQRGLGWEVGSVDRRQFEARWSEVLGEWAQRLGKHCDGWWLDGCNDYTYPAGSDWPRWLRACRAGNPAAAVAFNGGVNRFSEPWGLSDYMAGEASTLALVDRVVRHIRPLPNCQRHYLFPIDGYWGMYWKWPTKEWAHTEQLLRERPEMFDQAYLDGLRERGEFPQPVYTAAQLQSFLKKAAAAGAGTTLNVGIAPDGRLNPHSLKLLQALKGAATRRTVAFLGGSITEMDGFRPRVMQALRAKYPQVEFQEIAAGLSSTCSDAGAYRLKEDVLALGDPDLFIVEAAVNDEQDGGFDARRSVRGLEGSVRQIRARYPACAIVVGLMVNQKQYEQLRKGEVPVQYAAHSRVARHYGAAIADVGSALAEASQRGGLSWADYRDCHPSPAGCEFGAKVVMAAIDRVFDPLRPTATHALPPPLDEKSYFRGGFLPTAALRLGDGWQVSCPPWDAVPGTKRPYFTRGPAVWSDTNGAELSFRFWGTAAGAFLTAGPDAGDLEVAVDGGAYERQRLRANFGELHYPYVQLLADDLAEGPHEVRLRVAATTHGGQRATAVRIHRLCINGSAILPANDGDEQRK